MDSPEKSLFDHAVIVGCGLLGTSLGLAMKAPSAGRLPLARTITGTGRRGSASAEIALRRGAIDRATDDLAAAVAGAARDNLPPADLVVLCTPVRQFRESMAAMAPHLAKGATVTDVGSVKGQVMRWAEELLPAQATFVGSHPMAGSEKSGPEAARADLYRGAVCLVCPPANTSTEAARIEQLWRALGMRVISCGADEHDRWVAAVSHLPHMIAFSLMNAVGDDPAALSAAAGGFADMTRIASSDETMWTDIFVTNRPAIAGACRTFSSQLAQLAQAIDTGDEPAIRAALRTANAHRKAFLASRGSPAGKEP